jgi:hypothetical protein
MGGKMTNAERQRRYDVMAGRPIATRSQMKHSSSLRAGLGKAWIFNH